MKKSLLFLAAAAVAGVAVTGCSGNSDEKPTAIQNENTQADASGKMHLQMERQAKVFG